MAVVEHCHYARHVTVVCVCRPTPCSLQAPDNEICNLHNVTVRVLPCVFGAQSAVLRQTTDRPYVGYVPGYSYPGTYPNNEIYNVKLFSVLTLFSSYDC